ncbi:MAG TPA: hypothetical protein VE994_20705 [Terriglobales bacterium]|nr:hypothetical protein [Terriglobales bacterium]
MTPRTDRARVEQWRLLIVRRDGQELLLKADGARFVLPQVSIPANERIAANLNRAVERELGMQVISLYEVCGEQTASRDLFYHAAASLHPRQNVPAGAYWTSIPTLAAESFSEEGDFAAIRALQSGVPSSAAGEPFREPNWFRRVTAWVDYALQPYRAQLTGSFEQFNASPAFSLIRFDTRGTPVWFKAVGPPNTREFAITLALARLYPGYLPKLLDAKAEWNAWLAEGASGLPLSAVVDFRHWENSAASLASLQALTLSAANELRAKGARDLRPKSLLSRVAPFFESLREAAQDARLPERERFANLDWRELCATTEDALADLDELRLPDAIGHMDLNPQNIFCSDKRCVFLDWAEAFVGCPFFSFEYLLQHFRRAVRANPALEERFREAYVSPWRDAVEPRAFERAFTRCPLPALFAYASTLWGFMEPQASLAATQLVYLLSLARKMSRMARKARSLCI